MRSRGRQSNSSERSLNIAPNELPLPFSECYNFWKIGVMLANLKILVTFDISILCLKLP